MLVVREEGKTRIPRYLLVGFQTLDDDGGEIMEKLCPVCDLPFKDKENIIAVMLSTYKTIDSGVHFAITTPTQCLEIVHSGCYDFPPSEGMPQQEDLN